MPIIPYTPFPTEGPRPAPPEDYQRIQTNPRQFGAQVGAAEERLGAGATRAGEVFGQIASDDQANHVLEGLDDLNMRLRSLQGKDRMDQYPVIRQQMDDLVNQARGNLTTLNQQVDFDRQVRFLHSRALRESGDLYDQAQQQWGLAVNKGGANLSVLGISKAASAGDFDSVKNHEQDLINWRTKDAMLIYGHDLPPEIRNNVISGAKQESISAQVRALEPTNPTLAKKILDDNRDVFAGTPAYDALSNSVKAHAFRNEVDGLVSGALGGGAPSTTSGGSVSTHNLRNNNPGNMKAPGGGWMSFPTPEAGVNAIGDWLQRAQSQHGLTTVRQLIDDPTHGYAPSADPGNAGKGLPEVAAQFVGVGPDTRVDMADPATRSKMVRAILNQEQGPGFSPNAMQMRQAATDLGAQGGLVPSGPITPAYRSPGLTAALDHIASQDASPEAKELAATRVERRFNAQMADENRYEVALQKQRKEASDQRENQIIADASSPQPKITATDVGAEKLPDGSPNPLTPEAKMRMIRYINQESKPETLAHISQQTSMTLFSDIRRPTGDPAKITDTAPILDAYGNGLLTRADRDDLINQLTNAKDPNGEKLAVAQKEFITRFTPMITQANPLMGKVDPEGDAQLYNYDFAIRQKIADYRKAGKDPAALFDPRNPDFVGAPQFVRQFQTSFQQSLKAKTGSISAPPVPPAYPGTAAAPAVVPRQPGETPADYMRRIGAAVAPIPPAAAAPAPAAPAPAIAPPIAQP